MSLWKLFRKTPKPVVTAEYLLNAELIRLTQCTPRTSAEKQFALWIQQWQNKLKEVPGGKIEK